MPFKLILRPAGLASLSRFFAAPILCHSLPRNTSEEICSSSPPIFFPGEGIFIPGYFTALPCPPILILLSPTLSQPFSYCGLQQAALAFCFFFFLFYFLHRKNCDSSPLSHHIILMPLSADFSSPASLA